MKTLQPVITYRHSSLEDADNTLNTILDLIVEGTWDWNSNTGEVLRSPGWYRMLGYEVGTFKKDVFTWENVIHPEDYARVMRNFELYTGGQIDEYCIEYRCKKADGSYLWITDRALTVARDPDGHVARIVGAHQDIHARKVAQMELIEQNRLLKAGNVTLEKRLRKKAEELEKRNAELQDNIAQIEHISNTDPLTGIANRKKFEEELSKEKSRADRYHHSLSLAIFDIDHFKQVNDTRGHKAGDGVLQNLTALVAAHIRDIDVFARWGGEEFVLIFPDVPLDGALSVANKLRQLVSEQEMIPGLRLTCSFGVTEYQQGDSIEQLFARIDNALYMAKNSGRNRVELLAPDHHKA
ncbi:sensor domain-containing diguanylate cyclase [Marinobacterium maritimum]|uniref:diguanylate cyclase n=1 Tax=Marinobacterium maritimum TaxID=500162 RepID=A0ABP3TF50_9GAMM